VFLKGETFRIPKVVASEMQVESVQTLEQLKKSCVIGLRQMKRGVYEKLATNLFLDAPMAPPFLSKIQICSTLGYEVSCKCHLLHDREIARANWKGIVELRIKLVGLVSVCQELPGASVVLQESVRKIVNALFPANSSGVDYNALGEKLQDPSLKFALEQYLAMTKGAGTMDYSIREYFLRIITKTPVKCESDKRNPLYNLARVQSWAASISKKESLRYYVLDGMDFASVILKDLNAGKRLKFNPNLFVNCLEFCVSAMVACTTRFSLDGPATLPSSLVSRLAIIEPNVISNFQKLQNNDFMIMLFVKELCQLFTGGAVACLTGWLNDQRFEKIDKSNFIISLLKLVFALYLNFPRFQSEIFHSIFTSSTFDLLENVYFFPKRVGNFFAPVIDISQNQLSSRPMSTKQKEDEAKETNAMAFYRIVEWLWFANDNAITLAVGANVKREPASLIVVEGKGGKFTLQDYYQSKYTKWDKRRYVVKLASAFAEENVEDFAAPANLVTADPYPNAMIKSNFGEFLKTKLQRVRQRLAIRGKSNISVAERLNAEANLEFDDLKVKRVYFDLVIPTYSKLHVESAEITRCVELCDSKLFAKFRVMAFGIDEITELLHARLEYLQVQMPKLLPATISNSKYTPAGISKLVDGLKVDDGEILRVRRQMLSK
jgi:hypothetical protein